MTSTPGRGTLIEVFLKRSMEAASRRPAAAEAGLETGTGIVLVVEDDAAVRATTSGMLEDLGYSVLCAETGSAALKIIQADSRARPCLQRRCYAGRHERRRTGAANRFLRPELPILLTSGYTAQRVIPETPAGELALLKKPFSQADLSIAIRNLMAVSLEIEPHQAANLGRGFISGRRTVGRASSAV